MSSSRPVPRLLAAVAATALAVVGLTAVPAAAADPVPPTPAPAPMAADALPTVQIDGVVWQQGIAGTTVYAGGDFTRARPDGAAAGTSTVVRNNLLRYDVETGVLDAAWAPQPNAGVRAVAVSPDGRRVYVGGSFTSIAGAARYRIAAFDAATGQLVSSFAAGVDAPVRAIAATNTTVYVGGSFTNANGEPRKRLAAFDAATGAVLPWAPSADDGSVSGIAVSPDGSKVVVGGSFRSFEGSSDPGYGLARVDAVTGAMLPLPMNKLVRNAAPDASITSVQGDATGFYVSGYVYGSTGNLEGAARGSWETGELVWVEDCHGDTYGVWPGEGAAYIAGHPHYCGTVGGFPQTEPWSFYRALAFSTDATQTASRNAHSGYYNFEGNPAPTLLDWYPDLNTGSFTGQGQGPWTVTGNDKYLVYGGEFTIVNNRKQQGLVRFARRDVAPNKQGPRLGETNWPLSVVSFQAGTARLSWPANWDRDDRMLTYTVTRDGQTVHTEQAPSLVWHQPRMTFTDTGLTAGRTYTYRVRATDPTGNTAITAKVDVTVSNRDPSPYASAVLEDGATHLWRLGEPTGPTAFDWAGGADAVVGDGVARGTVGAIAGDVDGAVTLPGSAAGTAASSTSRQGGDTFAVEAWFRTTSTRGGKIVGFGNAATNASTSYDRHVYMQNDGRLTFGVYPGEVRAVTSPAAYNDGQWHHVVASLGAQGMQLYVDGKRVAQRGDTTSAQAYEGYWRIGGDNLDGWPSQPASRWFAGDVDDVAVYPGPLTLAQVRRHVELSGRTVDAPAAPTDAYGAAVHAAEPELYWRLSDTTGTVAADSGPHGVPGTYRGAFSRGEAGALAGVTDGAVRGTGQTNAMIVSSQSYAAPGQFSEELWFRTTTTAGGKLIGFGNRDTGTSTSYDRHVYMETDGRLTFGTWTGVSNTITSPQPYNDGAWHHLVATQGADGMRLYVDGVEVGSHLQRGAESFSGYWRVFGDTTWGPQPWFAGTIDEVAVYSRVLTPDEVVLHHALGTTGHEPSDPPTASFTVDTDDLDVSVDGSGSSDPDGDVVEWAWEFGDGGTATGVTATHTYAEAGTYTVTLTVTDDAGGTATATREVVVTAPEPEPTEEPTPEPTEEPTPEPTEEPTPEPTEEPTPEPTEEPTPEPTEEPNQAPTADFTAAATERTVALDASASGDPDGSVVAWSWDLGDGRTATGPTVSHTYDADGTYTVTLTVTDDDGATATASHDVTVAAPVVVDTPFAVDAFGRELPRGWGAADTGGAWTHAGTASGFLTTGGAGVIQVSGAGHQLTSYLPVESTSTDLTVKVALDSMPTGSGTDLEVAGRTIGTHDGYRVRLKMLSTGVVRASLIAITNRSVETLQQVNLPGITYAPGQTLAVRLQVDGSGTTALRAKVWSADQPEPATWTLSRTHAGPALQVPGGIGLSVYTSTSTTGLPMTARWTELAARPVVE